MPTNQPVVLLQERGGDRCLPIWIGAAEATAIAYAQQGIDPPRPLTHDLLKNVLEALDHELTQVRIVALEEGVFYATLVVDDDVEIDSRSSDAIALALRTGTPIVAPEELIESAGVALDADTQESGAEDEVERFKEFLDHVSAADFENPEAPEGRD